MACDGIQLHSPLSQCHTNVVTAPSGGYTAGQMVKIVDVVGVIIGSAEGSYQNWANTILQAGGVVAEGDETTFLYKAPMITVPCETAATGDYVDKERVYFDEANARVTLESSGNTLCGIVVIAADVGDTEVCIELDGMLGIVS